MFEPGGIADPAAGPVAEGEQGGAARCAVALNKRAKDIALVGRQLAGGQEWLRWESQGAHRVALKQALLLDQPAGEAVERSFAPRTVAHTQSLLLQFGEVDLGRRAREGGWVKAGGAAWSFLKPGEEVAQSAPVGIKRSRRLAGERVKVGRGQRVEGLGHRQNLSGTSFQADLGQEANTGAEYGSQ